MNWTYNNGVITVPAVNGGGVLTINLKALQSGEAKAFFVEKYAQQAEQAGQWAVAAEIWEIGGMLVDAEACAIIAAIEFGDQIRAKNKEQ